MKTIRELNIKDWSGYFFEEMVNILDIDPDCFGINTKQCRDGTIIYNICYNDKIGAPHIAFNNIDCYFKKMNGILLQSFVMILKIKILYIFILK